MNGLWTRLGVGFRCFFSILFHGNLPAELWQRITGSASSSAKEDSPSTPVSFDRAVQMLSLMQRDGRLIDFLAENIAGYPDAQLGAAVRAIHESCRSVLNHYVQLEPVLDSEEDRPVIVQAGFEPGSIKLTGNVAGVPPIRGVLRHKGWRVKEINLPPLPHGSDRMVVAPAEVELS